jgi:hypothetical protein
MRGRSALAILAVVFGPMLWTSPAWAYLDPGTGSMFLQGLLASLAAGVSCLWMVKDKVRSFFRSGDKEDRTDK